MQNKLNAKVFPNLPNRRQISHSVRFPHSPHGHLMPKVLLHPGFWNEFKWFKSVKLKQLCTRSVWSSMNTRRRKYGTFKLEPILTKIKPRTDQAGEHIVSRDTVVDEVRALRGARFQRDTSAIH